MQNGWIKLHRQLREWEWWQDSKTVHLFLHLLLLANHKDKKWQGTTVGAGQLITGLYSLSKATKISVQSLRTSLVRLESTKEITRKSTNKFTLITIVNWDKYQLLDQDTNNQSTNEQQTTNNQSTTNKNVKNVKKDKNVLNPEDYQNAELLKSLIQANVPKFKDPNIERWADEINKIHRIDEYSYQQIEFIIKWAQDNDFWRGNVLSPVKLRKHFTQLISQVKRSNKNKTIVI